MGSTAYAQEERDTSFTLMMNQDNFFGFYPSFNGLIELNDDIDFSFYGITWECLSKYDSEAFKRPMT